MNRLRFAPVLAAGTALVAAPAFAAAPVLTSLTEAIDTSTLQSAILAVGAIMIGVALTILAVRKVQSIMSGGK